MNTKPCHSSDNPTTASTEAIILDKQTPGTPPATVMTIAAEQSAGV